MNLVRPSPNSVLSLEYLAVTVRLTHYRLFPILIPLKSKFFPIKPNFVVKYGLKHTMLRELLSHETIEIFKQ